MAEPAAAGGQARARARRGREAAARRGTPHVIWHGLRREKAHYAGRVTRALLAGFRHNNLLTYASAIAFKVLFAIIPFLLFLLAVAGALHLQGVWENHLSGEVAHRLSPASFHVVDTTVEHVLHHERLFWATLGAAVTVWEVSGAVRGVMGAFGRIYGARSERGFWARMAISAGLAIVVGALLLLALAAVSLGSLVVGHSGGALGVVLFVARWAVALLVLLLAVAVLVRVAPGTPQPLHWVTFGALLTVVGWLIMSLLFRAYLTWVAHYGTIFGSVATVVVLMEYLYLSAIVFVGGIQVDALVREQVIGDSAGEAGGGRETRGPAPLAG